jgi:hypothetical protein
MKAIEGYTSKAVDKGNLKTESEYDVIDKALISYMINQLTNDIMKSEQDEIERRINVFNLQTSMTEDYSKFLEKSKNGDYAKEYHEALRNGKSTLIGGMDPDWNWKHDKFAGKDILLNKYMDNAPVQVKDAEFYKIQDFLGKDFENMEFDDYINIMGPIWELQHKYRTLDDEMRNVAIAIALVTAYTGSYSILLTIATAEPTAGGLAREFFVMGAKKRIMSAGIDAGNQLILKKGDFFKIDWVNVAASGLIKQKVLKNFVASAFDFNFKKGMTVKEVEDSMYEMLNRSGADLVFGKIVGSAAFKQAHPQLVKELDGELTTKGKITIDAFKKIYRGQIKDMYDSRYNK